MKTIFWAPCMYTSIHLYLNIFCFVSCLLTIFIYSLTETLYLLFDRRDLKGYVQCSEPQTILFVAWKKNKNTCISYKIKISLPVTLLVRLHLLISIQGVFFNSTILNFELLWFLFSLYIFISQHGGPDTQWPFSVVFRNCTMLN